MASIKVHKRNTTYVDLANLVEELRNIGLTEILMKYYNKPFEHEAKSIVDRLKRHDQLTYCICENCYKPFCQSHSVKFNDRYYCKEHDISPRQEKKGFHLFR